MTRALLPHKPAVSIALDCMAQLCKNHGMVPPTFAAGRCCRCRAHVHVAAENRDRFASVGLAACTLCECTKRYLDDAGMVEKAMLVTKHACVKHEDNKVALVREGMLDCMRQAFEIHIDSPATLRSVCAALLVLCTADDSRHPTSKALGHSKQLAAEGALALVFEAMRRHAALPPVLASLSFAVKAVAVTDEICKGVLEDGGFDLIVDALLAFPDDAALVRHATGALAALAKNDQAKARICETAALDAVLGSLLRHPEDEGVAERALSALATVMLRQPLNAELITERNGPHTIVLTMRAHPASARVQKQACLALRNMGARSPELRPAILAEGVEAAIRAARSAHSSCADVAFAALRDLGCDYHA